MSEVLSPIQTQGVLGALLVLALGTIVYLFRALMAAKDAIAAEKDARNSDAARSNTVFFPYLDVLKKAAEKATERDASEARKAEIRELQEEAARDREEPPPMRERVPTGKHRPYTGGGRRDGE